MKLLGCSLKTIQLPPCYCYSVQFSIANGVWVRRWVPTSGFFCISWTNRYNTCKMLAVWQAIKVAKSLRSNCYVLCLAVFAFTLAVNMWNCAARGLLRIQTSGAFLAIWTSCYLNVWLSQLHWSKWTPDFVQTSWAAWMKHAFLGCNSVISYSHVFHPNLPLALMNILSFNKIF